MSSNKSYKLTAKGFLAVETGLLSDIDPLWDRLANFVAEQAKKNGMSNGFPCLVFVGGGVCITADLSGGNSDEPA